MVTPHPRAFSIALIGLNPSKVPDKALSLSKVPHQHSPEMVSGWQKAGGGKQDRSFVIGPEDKLPMHPYFFWFCINQLRDLDSLAKKPQMVCVDVRALWFSLQSGKDDGMYRQKDSALLYGSTVVWGWDLAWSLSEYRGRTLPHSNPSWLEGCYHFQKV